MSSPANTEPLNVHTNSAPEGRTGSVRRWAEVALIFLVFFVAAGAPVPHVNETHYLAKAKQYWQPDWCAGDLFLESGKAHVTFYWTVGVLTKWLPLTTVAWIGRIVAWLALAFTWQRLSRTVVGLPFGAVLTAMLFVTLIDWTNFAGEWVIGGVEGKCFAYALVFWGLAAMAEGRWRTAWPCLGLAGAFHVLVGGWATIAAGMVWLCQPRAQRPTLKAMLPALVLGGALALPGVLPALQLTQTVSPETVDAANQIYVFDRLPHHLSPLTMRDSELRKKTLRFGLLLVGFALLHFLCSRQSLSTTDQKQTGKSLSLLMQFALATVLISLAGLAWELATWNHPSLSAKILKYYVFRLADIALPLATCLGVGWLVQRLTCRQSKWGLLLLLAMICFPAWHLGNISWARYENPCPPADRGVRYPLAFYDACAWADQNTATDALFLVPCYSQSFKWHANRRDLVTWKDVPQSPAALLTWRDRLFDVHKYFDEEEQKYLYRGSLASQGTERILMFAEKYQLDYVLTLTQVYPPVLLPVAYKNDFYTIYSVKQTTSPTRTGADDASPPNEKSPSL